MQCKITVWHASCGCKLLLSAWLICDSLTLEKSESQNKTRFCFVFFFTCFVHWKIWYPRLAPKRRNFFEISSPQLKFLPVKDFLVWETLRTTFQQRLHIWLCLFFFCFCCAVFFFLSLGRVIWWEKTRIDNLLLTRYKWVPEFLSEERVLLFEKQRGNAVFFWGRGERSRRKILPRRYWNIKRKKIVHWFLLKSMSLQSFVVLKTNCTRHVQGHRVRLFSILLCQTLQNFGQHFQ